VARCFCLELAPPAACTHISLFLLREAVDEFLRGRSAREQLKSFVNVHVAIYQFELEEAVVACLPPHNTASRVSILPSALSFVEDLTASVPKGRSA
jgi:hypothetical protein